MEDAYDLDCTVVQSSLQFSTVRTNINADKPVITSTYYTAGFHAFVVCGFYDDGTTEYVIYMDPASGSLITSECINGLMKYVYNGVNYATYNYIRIN